MLQQIYGNFAEFRTDDISPGSGAMKCKINDSPALFSA